MSDCDCGGDSCSVEGVCCRLRSPLRSIETDMQLVGEADGVVVVSEKEQNPAGSGLHGDRLNVLFLAHLYLMEGLSVGLTAAMPFVLQEHGVTYSQQSSFGLSMLPFVLKLLWSPLVDVWSLPGIGRRKSWLIPCHLGSATLFAVLFFFPDRFLGGDGAPPDVAALFGMFFTLNLLAATADVVIDGWGIGLLQRRNVGYAGVCNSAGLGAGFLLSFTTLLLAQSSTLCTTFSLCGSATNKAFSFSGLMLLWCLCFLCTVLMVTCKGIPSSDAQKPSSIMQTYSMLWSIIKLKPVLKLTLILLTYQVHAAASLTLTHLKLTERGVPKDIIALGAVPMALIQVFIPLCLGRFVVGRNSIVIFATTLPVRLFFLALQALVVYFTSAFRTAEGTFPLYYYALLVVSLGLSEVTFSIMLVTLLAFFSRVADPDVGSSYITLLSTITNCGTFPNYIMLWLVDSLTWSECSSTGGYCHGSYKQECLDSGGACTVLLDGYFLEVAFCLLYGIVWLFWGYKQLLSFRDTSSSVWKVVKTASHIAVIESG